MAKTTSQVAVTQGSGINLSMFTLTSGRYRETVVVGDADADGESLLVELPAHDSADRGSPLKIGGKASASPLSAVAELDRTDAWFSLNGQLSTINTHEPAACYDGGRHDIQYSSFSQALNNSGLTLVAAIPGMKSKLLGLSVSVSGTVTTAGTLAIRDGAGGSSVFIAGYYPVGSLGAPPYVHYSSMVPIAQSSTNTLLQLFFGGAATLEGHIFYYQA